MLPEKMLNDTPISVIIGPNQKPPSNLPKDVKDKLPKDFDGLFFGILYDWNDDISEILSNIIWECEDWSSLDFPATYIWTRNLIWFVVEHDGCSKWFSIPRNPTICEALVASLEYL